VTAGPSPDAAGAMVGHCQNAAKAATFNATAPSSRRRRFKKVRRGRAQSADRGRRDPPKGLLMNEIYSLFIIALIAVLAPLLGRLPALMRTPVIVLELVFGILIGPSGANWVTSEGAIGFLGQFGLTFLFFQAGFEFNQHRIDGAPLRLGAIAWLASLGVAALFVGLLFAVGLLRAPLLVWLLLPTTAFGILLPILRQTGDCDSNFGRYVLGAAAVGELGPVLLASIALAHANHHLHQTLLSMVFLAFAVGAILLAKRLRSEKLTFMIERWLGDSSVLPVRISILILLGLVSLANELGMEVVLGAYTAGTIVAMLVRDTKAETLEDRLTSIGSGFFIPLFFVTSGVEFDLPALVTNPGSLVRLFLFCAAFLVIRVIPIRLYKNALPERDLLPLALLSSTTLPLVAAVTYLGMRTGQMEAENAAALVGAAVISVALFPTLAISLRSKPGETPSGVESAGLRRVADVVAARLLWVFDVISLKNWRKET
jgi:Kef-type K+ transport system membrane component KefB